jgi:hypothetical protein
MPRLPSSDAISAAMQRAEGAAARVFLDGDLGGPLRFTVEPGANSVPKTCDTVDVLPGRMKATISKRRRR